MSDLKNTTVECGVVTLEIPARYSFLRIVRQAVSAVSVHAGISEFRAAELEMAVDEVCSRIVETRTAQQMGNVPIRISLIQESDRVVVEFSSVSPDVGFNENDGIQPETIDTQTSLNDLRSYVVKRFVDTLDIQPGAGRDFSLRLTKIL